MVCTAL